MAITPMGNYQMVPYGMNAANIVPQMGALVIAMLAMNAMSNLPKAEAFGSGLFQTPAEFIGEKVVEGGKAVAGWVLKRAVASSLCKALIYPPAVLGCEAFTYAFLGEAQDKFNGQSQSSE